MMKKDDQQQQRFEGVTHYTHVDVQPGGINIQHVEHLHQADLLQALGIELEVKHKGGTKREAGTRPERLATPEASQLMELLVDAGLIDHEWQPNGLSGTERAMVAKMVCERLGVNDTWQVFGQLWNEKPQTLRSYLNKALEQRKTLNFQEKLKRILH